VTLEDPHAQFILEFDDGLGHPRLGRVQRTGGFGQVEVAPDRFADKTELLQVHDNGPIGAAIIWNIEPG
jgi:hypothetical protein